MSNREGRESRYHARRNLYFRRGKPAEETYRDYLRTTRQAMDYGFVDERERYGRRGDYEGSAERGYRGEDYEYDEGTVSEEPEWEYGPLWGLRGPYRGAGPRGYQRPDESIFEDVCENLTRHGQVDASDIEVEVVSGEVTLRGSVHDRRQKRMAEDAAEAVSGVVDVHNRLILKQTEPAEGKQQPKLPPRTEAR